MFNSLKYAKQLIEVGVSPEQADVQMQIMVEIIETNLATKQDIKDLAVEIGALRTDMKHGFVELEQRMVIKLGVITVSAITLAVGVASFIVKLIVST